MGKGQMVKVISGRQQGKVGYFVSYSKRPGGQHCFIQFPQYGRTDMAQVRVDEIREM